MNKSEGWLKTMATAEFQKWLSEEPMIAALDPVVAARMAYELAFATGYLAALKMATTILQSREPS